MVTKQAWKMRKDITTTITREVGMVFLIMAVLVALGFQQRKDVPFHLLTKTLELATAAIVGAEIQVAPTMGLSVQKVLHDTLQIVFF